MAGFPEELYFSTLTELSARLRAKEFSCVELTRAYLDRLERLGPRLNALALLLRETALNEAREVDCDL